MDTVIAFTFRQMCAGVLAVCSGISVFAVAIGWVIKAINKVKEPGRKLDERLTALEQTTAQHSEYFANDKKKLETMEEGNRVTQRAILALLSHGIDGNDIDALKSAKTELQQYLIER